MRLIDAIEEMSTAAAIDAIDGTDAIDAIDDNMGITMKEADADGIITTFSLYALRYFLFISGRA